MSEQIARRLLRWCNLILYAASLLVPRRRRSEWLREWRAEVWHWAHFLVESGRLSVKTEEELFRHCWGSFGDALWCRFNRTRVLGFLRSYPATPRFCLLTIFLLILAALILSPSSLWRSYEYASNAGSLLTVSLNGNSHWLEPELLWDAAVDWAQHDPLIAGAATYAWRRSVIAGPGGRQDVLSARVTPEIFQLLGAKPVLGQVFDNIQCSDCVVLSHAIWREQFPGDTGLSGEFVNLNGRRVRVMGVLSDRFRLPDADVQVYTPFQGAPFARLPGFEWPGVILRLANGFPAKSAKPQIQREVRETNFPSPALLDVLSLTDVRYRVVGSWLAMGAFATLVLVALNWQASRQLWATRPRRTILDLARWWGFFALKSVLLLALAWLLSVDLVEGALQRLGLVPLQFAGGVAMWTFLVGLNIALGWSIRDQNDRCRSCLTRLRTQIVLSASAVPLWDPSGCDLLCDRAHGMLHIPAMQFSSLDSERWIDFDESWQTLAQDV